MTCDTTITTGEINTAMKAAITAQEAGDYDTALTKLMSVRMYMAAKPDTDFDREKLLWKPEQIDRIYQDLLKLKRSVTGNASGKLMQIPVRRKRSDFNSDSSTDCVC